MKYKKIYILIILGLIISFNAYYITKRIGNYQKQRQIEKRINKTIDFDQDTTFISLDFNKLRVLNKDIIGYIEVIGTKISYPIVQGKDNKYYLNHSLDKTKNETGAIFADYRNDFNNLNKNTIIYGHGLLDGTMFGSLKEVFEDKWLKDKNKHYIKLTTLNSKMIWEIFSVYTIQKESYYLTTYFSDDKYFNEFINIIKKRSIYNFSVKVNNKDKILTLSTCQNDFGKRIVVHAKLFKEQK